MHCGSKDKKTTAIETLNQIQRRASMSITRAKQSNPALVIEVMPTSKRPLLYIATDCIPLRSVFNRFYVVQILGLKETTAKDHE